MMQAEEAARNLETYALVQHVRGFPFPKNRFFHEEDIEASLNLQPRDTDIIISTYPKCGTNWVKYIVHTILTNGQKPLVSNFQLTYEAVPFVEISGTSMLDEMPDPRPLQYHLPYHLIPKNPKTKYIYLIRSPKDAVVSYYYFAMLTNEIQIDFDVFFEGFMKGEMPYGDYFDHVLSWYEHRNDQNVLFLSYEQLHTNTRDQYLNIAKFLGDSYHEALLEDDDLMELVLKQTSFVEMKKLTKERPVNNDDHQPTKATDVVVEPVDQQHHVNYLQFFRKGMVGDWKGHLSAEQNRRMEEKMLEKFDDTDIIQMFHP